MNKLKISILIVIILNSLSVFAQSTAGIYLGSSVWAGSMADIATDQSKTAFRLDVAYQLSAVHAVGFDFYTTNKGVAETYKNQNTSIDANNWSVQGLSLNYKYKYVLTEDSFLNYKAGLQLGHIKTTNSVNGNSVSGQYIAPGVGLFYNYLLAHDENNDLSTYTVSVGLQSEYIPEITLQNKKYTASINQLLLGFCIGL